MLDKSLGKSLISSITRIENLVYCAIQESIYNSTCSHQELFIRSSLGSYNYLVRPAMSMYDCLALSLKDCNHE